MGILTEHELRIRLDALTTHASRERISIEGYHTAGVLVPIVFGNATPELLFTKRTELVETHKRQVSFPGGMMDPEDGTITHTALREAWEEIGIPGSAVAVVGLLNDLSTPTGFVITPVIGVIDRLPELRVNKAEVDEVFRIPIAFFADPANGRMEIREVGGKGYEVWFYKTDKHTIWGATAKIIRSLLQSLEAV